MRWVSLWVACASIAFGCAGEAGSARPSALASSPVAGEGTQRADVEAPATPSPPAASDGALVTIRAIAPASAEDGLGHVVQAAAPVAIDLDGHVFRPRALDPVLTIGQSCFTHYTHPRPGVLRFVIADAALLVRGEAMSVHYARDASDARVVVESIGEAEERAARQP